MNVQRRGFGSAFLVISKFVQMIKNNCFVITGGPGVGKTTLLTELAKSGFEIIPENAREIIRQEMEINGDGLPWKNKERYTRLMFEAAVASFHAVPSDDNAIRFFDRGLPDSLAYAEMEQLPVSEEMEQAGRNLRYNQTVFILPPWEEIYHTDNERKQTWEEALWTFEKLKETYLKYGYELIEVPRGTVEERVGFVLGKMPSIR
ncbi:hypothetical protein D3C86_1225330 [compost metagenome]